MARRLGWFLVLLAAALPAAAAGVPGSIAGYVKNSSGVPQMGAAVEILAPGAAQAVVVFTDAQGFFKAAELQPGAYRVKASAPSYLPSIKENLALRAGANLLVNLTVSTLFEAAELLPARHTAPQQQDDWKWTLRTVASRPILRVLDEPPANPHPKRRTGPLKAQVSFVAGGENEGFGSASEMSTQFRLEQSLFSTGTVSLGGNVGYGSGIPGGVVRAAYTQDLGDFSRPEVRLTARHFATPETAGHNAALDALALRVGDGITVADLLDLDFGSDLQTIQFRGRVTALRPYGSAAVHVSPNTVVQYRYATSQPDTRSVKGFDTAPADLSESGPRMSLRGDRPALEHAQHHEISVSHRFGGTNVQLAAFSDHIAEAALVGVGEVTADSGDFLPDVYSGTFTYNGGNLSTRGVRVVVERKILPSVTGTVDYGYGGVIDAPGGTASWQDARSMLHVERRHAVAFKAAGDVPGSKTHWIASYKWTNGAALTPVDMFNASPGEADPYFSIFIRQPFPASILSGRMEALVDLRNLLAQGYVPFAGQDGQTLYLVQTARSVRGGLVFTF